MAFFARSNCPLERLIFDAGVQVWMTEERRAEYTAFIPSLYSVDVDVLLGVDEEVAAHFTK